MEKEIEALHNAEEVEAEEKVENSIPDITSKDWQDYVFSKLTPGTELFEEDGRKIPNGHGLRRVFEELIGSIVQSYPTVLTPPKILKKDDAGNFLLEVVTVKWTIQYCDKKGYSEFSDVACVFPGNTTGIYINHPVETAASKAEARALRKALRLNCVSREELGVSDNNDPYSGNAGSTLIQAAKNLCESLKISHQKLFNMYAKKYIKQPENMPANLGHKIMQKLNEWRKDESQIPKELY